MKKRYILVFIFSIIFLCTFYGKNEPKLTVNKDIYDLGKIRMYLRYKFEFVLKNKGKAPLTINDVVSDCGCTVVSDRKFIIEPKKTYTLTGVFDSSNYYEDVSQNIRIISNDPKNNEKLLTVKAYVVHNVDFQPYKIEVTDVLINKKIRKYKVFIEENETFKPFEVLEIKSPVSYISADIILNKTKRNEIEITIDPKKVSHDVFYAIEQKISISMKQDKQKFTDYLSVIIYSDNTYD